MLMAVDNEAWWREVVVRNSSWRHFGELQL